MKKSLRMDLAKSGDTLKEHLLARIPLSWSRGRCNICLPRLSKTVERWAMKMCRFVIAAHHDVSAETLEEAMEAFNEVKRKGLPPKVDMVSRIEVQDEKGEYIPVDYPLRAGIPAANKEEEIHLSA
jgi:hypothetical protein